MTIGTNITNRPPRSAGTAQADAGTREEIANLRSDLAYLRQQVHGLRSKLHGELAVLALRIEDNERRAMKRRKVARRWLMAAVLAVSLWLGSIAVRRMLNGPFLLPGLLLVGMTLLGAITLVLLNVHNDADEQEHSDRHHNWFRLTARDDDKGRLGTAGCEDPHPAGQPHQAPEGVERL
jgi:hypothetical protein